MCIAGERQGAGVSARTVSLFAAPPCAADMKRAWGSLIGERTPWKRSGFCCLVVLYA